MLKLVALSINNSPKLILDMGCGEGRNALALAGMGHHVIAADIDLTRLRALDLKPRTQSGKISCVAVNFLNQNWPFSSECFDLVVSIHFPDYRAIVHAHRYIKKGGLLYFDSVGGQGQNYRQLPDKNQLKETLSSTFALERYEERSVGPKGQNAAAVRLLARRT